MFNKVFEFIQSKRKSKLIMPLAHNYGLSWIGGTIKFYAYKRTSHDFSSSIKFFSQNATRIKALTDILADEKSKKVYNGMIKFRQTGNRKDFPTKLCDKTQYFIDKIKLTKNEVFVDCGAFTGDTIDVFLKHCPEYKQIIAFEAATLNFKHLQAKHGSAKNATLINAGVGDSNGTISFTSDGNSGTIIAGGGDVINTNSIDSLEIDNITFIKMDIEGAELKALKGAQKTILKNKPKLAICIYHSDEDMLNIPEFIHNLVPEYKLYIRQHDKRIAFCMYETVVYAVI